jgi:hypothetical protein
MFHVMVIVTNPVIRVMRVVKHHVIMEIALQDAVILAMNVIVVKLVLNIKS